MNNISLTDALNQMEQNIPFQIKYISYSRQKKAGGEIIEFKSAVKCGAKFNLKVRDMINLKQVDSSNHPHPVHIHLITQFNNKNVFI